MDKGTNTIAAWMRRLQRCCSDRCVPPALVITGAPLMRPAISEEHARTTARVAPSRKSRATKCCARRNGDQRRCPRCARVRCFAAHRCNLQRFGFGAAVASAKRPVAHRSNSRVRDGCVARSPFWVRRTTGPDKRVLDECVVAGPQTGCMKLRPIQSLRGRRPRTRRVPGRAAWVAEWLG